VVKHRPPTSPLCSWLAQTVRSRQTQACGTGPQPTKARHVARQAPDTTLPTQPPASRRSRPFRAPRARPTFTTSQVQAPCPEHPHIRRGATLAWRPATWALYGSPSESCLPKTAARYSRAESPTCTRSSHNAQAVLSTLLLQVEDRFGQFRDRPRCRRTTRPERWWRGSNGTVCHDYEANAVSGSHIRRSASQHPRIPRPRPNRMLPSAAVQSRDHSHRGQPTLRPYLQKQPFSASKGEEPVWNTGDDWISNARYSRLECPCTRLRTWPKLGQRPEVVAGISSAASP
jgi:hypothetical protein